MKGLFINIYPKLLGRAGEVKEGGLSRDRGYYDFLMKSGQWESVDLPSSSVSAALTVLKTNITAKNRKLLFLYAHFLFLLYFPRISMTEFRKFQIF